MTLKGYLHINNWQKQRLDGVAERYKSLYEDPEHCRPMIIINVPQAEAPTWEAMLADPLLMLKTQLDAIRPHLEMEDDYLPTVRVNFGTAQVAAAFGCQLATPTNSLPAAAGPVLSKADDIYHLARPSLDAGWYGKLAEWTDIWLENLPPGVCIQHPDISGPFNTAQLLRGKDILTDFYDAPEMVERLLDIVTNYMIDLVPHLKREISNDKEWFLDWGGALWKGTARLCNCSSHMISPQFYTQYVFPRDARVLKSIGGGRMHYCGTPPEVITQFLKITSLTGLDVDAQYHDLWALGETVPRHVVLAFQYYGKVFPHTNRLLAGDWPRKRNIILYTQAESVEQGKNLLSALQESMPYD